MLRRLFFKEKAQIRSTEEKARDVVQQSARGKLHSETKIAADISLTISNILYQAH